MRLYLVCYQCQNKIYLSKIVSTRDQLPYTFELRCPICSSQYVYDNGEVVAESSSITGSGSAVVAGLAGLLLGGPLGALIGGISGAIVGSGFEESDRAAVERFNQS